MKPSCLLLGRHVDRNPLAYDVYKPLFEEYLNFVDASAKADLVILSHVADFDACSSEIKSLKSRNSKAKIVVLSEEPFWDTIQYDNFQNWKCSHSSETISLEYYFLNHITSEIYTFDHVPYFITTNNLFFPRYAYRFFRNSSYTTRQLSELWNTVKIKAAFFAEKRLSEKFDVCYPKLDVYGLSRYRSLIAQAFSSDEVLRIGLGWVKGLRRRQLLDDWHLEKLLVLDRQAFFVSALENTHHPNYLTEKLFDAFAVLALPLYWASPAHRAHEIFGQGFVNLYGNEPEEAVRIVDNFELTDDFIEAYRLTQQQLKHMFSSVGNLLRERKRVVAKVIHEFDKVLSTVQ